MREFKKGPNDHLDYTIDWSGPDEEGGPWLEPGDTIATSQWLYAIDGTITVTKKENTPTTATVWVYGGEDGGDYRLTNRILTTGGRTVERVFAVKVAEPA